MARTHWVIVSKPRSYNRETHLPAEPSRPQAPPRLPRAHGHQEWPKSRRPSPCQGPQAPDCLTRSSDHRHRKRPLKRFEGLFRLCSPLPLAWVSKAARFLLPVAKQWGGAERSEAEGTTQALPKRSMASRYTPSATSSASAISSKAGAALRWRSPSPSLRDREERDCPVSFPCLRHREERGG